MNVDVRPLHTAENFPARLVAIWLVLFLLNACALSADDTLRQVQRELRARKYYFGPADGRTSVETTKAIEEFQRAKALDANGDPDEETLRALGLAPGGKTAESRALELGRDWLTRYWQACESGDWTREERFYADKVRYYFEGEVTRDYVRKQREKFYETWPVRHEVPLLCYASWNPRRADELWISARVRNDVKDRDGAEKVFTEELLFILRKSGAGWQLAEVREWPLAKPKSLP